MKSTKQFNRRKFLKGLSAASVGALTIPATSFAHIAKGSGNYSDNIFVFLFMRGGMDGLGLLAPMDGHPDRVHYDNLRVNGTNIASNDLLSVGENFGLHPAAIELHELYQQNELAIVRAIGLPEYELNFSHFEAQRYAELGTPGNRHTPTGWLTRHWQTATNHPDDIPLPIAILEHNVTFSLLREPFAITMRNPDIFHMESSTWEGNRLDEERVLAELYETPEGEIEIQGDQAIGAMQVVNSVDFQAPVDNEALYPTQISFNLDLGGKLKKIAQLIKQGTGLRIAQADHGNWDTHDEQSTVIGGNIAHLSQALKAFFLDLDVPVTGGSGETWKDRTTVMVYSEFGRRVTDNTGGGTDHGWAGTSLVLGAGVNGGQMYGQWPGLAPDDLFENSLHGTVDYRNIMAEILIKRFANNNIGEIFPGFPEAEYNPLGVVSGSDLQPIFGTPSEVIFKNGFD